jgi:hypothetical protein
VSPALRGAQVTGLLDGTDAEPPKTIQVQDKVVPNPEYASWIARDQAVLNYLVNSVSPDIFAHLVGLDTTQAVWTAITKMFST